MKGTFAAVFAAGLAGIGAARAEAPQRLPGRDQGTVRSACWTSPSAEHGSAERHPADVCQHERAQLALSEQGHLSRHPRVVNAQARVAAACRPAPSGDCAAARAELAETQVRYLPSHPKLLIARAREEILCAPATPLACARARASLAEAKVRYLDRNPKIASAAAAVATTCGAEAPR